MQESVEKWQALAQDSSEALELKEEEFKLTVNNFEGMHISVKWKTGTKLPSVFVVSETVKSVTDELAQSKRLYDELVLDSEKRMKTVLVELDSQTKVTSATSYRHAPPRLQNTVLRRAKKSF